MTLEEAREAIDAMRGKKFVNVSTGIAAQLSSSAKGKLVSNKATGKSVEAIKVEALDRIVEVVSGNTPHASSASTENRIASSPIAVKWGRPIVWIAGSVLVALGVGKIVCNVHEQFEAIKYREMFWGVVGILCGAFLLYVDHILTERRRKS